MFKQFISWLQSLNPVLLYREHQERLDTRASTNFNREADLLELKLKSDLEQRILLNDTLKYLADQNTQQTQAMKELALRVADNNELATGTIGKWLDSFTTHEAPTSSVATEDDEVYNYINRTRQFEHQIAQELQSSEFLKQAASPVPPEMALALQLHRTGKH